MNVIQAYRTASVKTADNLRTIAQSAAIRDLSRLSLPEIEAISSLIGEILPAGNIPGIILSGLTRISGRAPSTVAMRRDINLLFRGVEQMLDKVVYSTVFAGPAAVIWGYQNLLRLAGKNPDDAFPDGTWQFYLEYALREDTARHANETHGFDTYLRAHQLNLSPVDRITAWAMAAIHCLHQYDDLLANEWRERVAIALLADVVSDHADLVGFKRVYRLWQDRIPYQRGSDTNPKEDYPSYRRRKFQAFLDEVMERLPDVDRITWEQRFLAAEVDLPAYQRQMTILAYLDPGRYGETRRLLPLEQVQIGLVYQGLYHLIPVCETGSSQPVDVDVVRGKVAAMLATSPPIQKVNLEVLAACRRSSLANLRASLDPDLVSEVDRLRYAPILLNCDPRPPHLPLSLMRQAERGVGDHALTIFDTGEAFIFDQSHIFFDGAWGAALAEILTNEALSWAAYLIGLSPSHPDPSTPPLLNLQIRSDDLVRIRQAPQATPEAGAENDTVDLKALLKLRQMLKQRNDLLNLTVNDLLILYRAIHAVTYQPNLDLLLDLQTLGANPSWQEVASQVWMAVSSQGVEIPSILIPIDASQSNPRQRLYPVTFEVPLLDLDFLGMHRRVLESLAICQKAAHERAAQFIIFDEGRRAYLAMLAGFGEVMSKVKSIALSGESLSVGSIKLLAHLPVPLQRILDRVANRTEILNDLIKGREIFSNLGAVSQNSTLSRFITAKDDNEKKMLAWGVMTDAQGIMHISLRDFRPHVSLLRSIGRQDLANRITQDYLDAYARGLNTYVRELYEITLASHDNLFG